MARKKRNNKEDFTSSDEYDHDFYNSEDEFNDEPPMLSRSDSRKAKKTGIFRYPLLNILIIFFLLIPIISVIVFVAVQNSAEPANQVKEEENVSVDSNSKAKQAAKEKEEEEKAAKEKAAKEKEEAEKAAAEKAKAEEEQKAKDAEAAKQAEAEKAAAEKAAAEKAEQERVAAEKAAQEKAAAEKAAQEKQAAEAAKKQAEAAQASSHTVQSGETLYRIAANAYGESNATAGVQKIKQANGLSSDSVPVGTVLKIPK
ncbi:LysM domain-containing protein [Listeria floridensis FSL S10-1187]|uniref:LysM domain-containing protein n=1 Tax=Listeria floridensis FSL S10-1187 TaxID=1265817 RepID=A0ABN0RGI9_9LIST|nr:LysM peptidoglycan-binding domain-containing protein [Listeria floridensis]EUJ32920.1 LysM domain-containing protein [Listeria floridensis FSL S10-1187]